jgi:hypothetical protein
MTIILFVEFWFSQTTLIIDSSVKLGTVITENCTLTGLAPYRVLRIIFKKHGILAKNYIFTESTRINAVWIEIFRFILFYGLFIPNKMVFKSTLILIGLHILVFIHSLNIHQRSQWLRRSSKSSYCLNILFILQLNLLFNFLSGRLFQLVKRILKVKSSVHQIWRILLLGL